MAGQDRLEGRVIARRGTVQLPRAEPIVFALAARVTVDTKRGMSFDELALTGDFGEVRGTGSIEDFSARA